MKRIGVLGSTGSIGNQTLDVVRKNPGKFKIEVISGHRNVELLLRQSEEFSVPNVIITDKDSYDKAKNMNFSARIHYGVKEINQFINEEYVDLILNALVGNVGLMATYTAVKNKVQLALANKESLVTAGEIVMQTAKDNNQVILPVDSEHSAIFQCLQGNVMKSVKRIIITASGGPFQTLPRQEIESKKAYEALKHPKWNMGRKISIDSATLVNKGLEVIEAKWLFDLDIDQIKVVVHPQSIIHSMVQYTDSSIIAQMGNPDMRMPIHYALNYPDRMPIDLEDFDFLKNNQLTFEEPNLEVFPGLKLGIEAMKNGGTMPTIYNTVNEMMVMKYLKDEIGFYQITDQIEKEMQMHRIIEKPSIEEIINLDFELRNRFK